MPDFDMGDMMVAESAAPDDSTITVVADETGAGEEVCVFSHLTPLSILRLA
jgi:hypothetical protein